MTSAHILVVDDEPSNLEILSRWLAQQGHTCAGAGHAEAAVAALAGGVFDFVLLDNILPGVTGLQALARLRTLTKAPIYVMSGYVAEEMILDAELLGASGFLPKPIDLPALLVLLQALPERP